MWATRHAGTAVSYPSAGLGMLAGVESVSPWHAERNRLIGAALAREGGLPTQFLEIGAGNGIVSAHLRDLGVDATAVEPDRGAAAVSAGRGVPTICGLLEDLRLPAGSIEAAGLFDVIEHVSDPGPLLVEAHRILAADGVLAVTVPAMPSLWSQADEHAGHFRRYDEAQLRVELERAGFRVEHCQTAFLALVPVVWVTRTLPYQLGRRRTQEVEARVGTRQVAAYGRLGRAAGRLAFAAERPLRRWLALPSGTSLIATARPGR